MVRTPSANSSKGAQRRDELIQAAADLVLASGFTALSHRAVAARAGLPLASTTYYFSSAEELRREALRRIAEHWAERSTAAIAALPATLDRAGAARAVGAIIGVDGDPTHALLLYERFLEAGRHPDLRPLVTSWNERARALVQQVLSRASTAADDGSASLVLAVADGTAVAALAEGAAPEPVVVRAVERVLALL